VVIDELIAEVDTVPEAVIFNSFAIPLPAPTTAADAPDP
jgi:hypothetical protein